jgi:hypothetical protein
VWVSWSIVRSPVIVSGVVCLMLVPCLIVPVAAPVIAWCKMWSVVLVVSSMLVVLCRVV